MVACLAHFFTGAFYSMGAGRVPAHLLLLSRGVLQSVLGRSSGMYRWGTAQDLLGRAVVPAHHAEHPPIFSLSGAFDHFDPCLRRLERPLVCRSCDRENFIRYWHRHHRARDQCVLARRLHIWLSLITTFDRRISRSTCKLAEPLSRLRLRELLESSAHALGVA